MNANNCQSRYRNADKSYNYKGVDFKIVISLYGYKSIIYLEDEEIVLTSEYRDKLVVRSEEKIESLTQNS